MRPLSIREAPRPGGAGGPSTGSVHRLYAVGVYISEKWESKVKIIDGY